MATADVLLIGAGIMSATLGTVLKELEPSLSVVMVETLADCAQESSDAWNNAGTGHAANCELNYTPQRPDGSVDIAKALEVNTEFDISRQLWAHLVGKGAIPDPRAFLHPCPHMSVVWGEENVAFLKRRFQEMSAHHCYHGMEYSEDHAQIAAWAPLTMEGRDPGQPVAATRIVTGADVDYGALTHLLVAQLAAQPGFAVHYRHEATGIARNAEGSLVGHGEGPRGQDHRRDRRALRLHRRGRRRAAAAAEVGHPGRPRLWRLPGQRHLAALRRRGDQRAPPRQGLWQGGAWLAAHVGAASRYPHHRRQAVAAVRPLCRLLQQIPQARLLSRPGGNDRAPAMSCPCSRWRATIGG
jgi:hypothetical protein